MIWQLLVAVAGVSLFAQPAAARTIGRATRSNSSITLRKRLHVDSLIAEPGTGEIDWSALYSFSTVNFQMPSALKWTPEGDHIIWGRTEYSLAFDSITTAQFGGTRETQFAQTLTFAATSVVYDGERLDIAIAPQASFFLHDESGARLGAIAIARYDWSRNNVAATASWSGATHSSPTNPAGVFDVGFGSGRQLSGSRFLERLTPHFNVIWEKPTGQVSALSLFEGIEYQLNDRIAFDLSGQHFSVTGGPVDHQIVLGITIGLGGH